jgi:hypothetical protein
MDFEEHGAFLCPLWSGTVKKGIAGPLNRIVPTQDQVEKFDIFDKERFNVVQPQKMKEKISRLFGAFSGLGKKVTMAHIEDQLRALAAQHTELGSVYAAKNVGPRSDWYADAASSRHRIAPP